MTGSSLTVPCLSTDRLRFVPLSRTHSEGMFRLWSHPEVCRYSGPAEDPLGRPVTLPARTADDSDKIIDFWLQAQADGWGFRWAVEHIKDDTFIGIVGFNSLGQTSEIAFHLRPDYWGHGLMTEAARRAMVWALAQKPCFIIEAYIDPENKRSLALADRLALKPLEEDRDGARRFQLLDR